MTMTNKLLALAFLATSTLMGVQAHAAPAYVINEIEVTDPAAFKTYAERQGALIQSFGGHFLARGGATETLEGPKVGARVTIYVFDSMDKLNAWKAAPEQKDLIALRDRSSHFRAIAVEGLAN
jgi:uncharacterized protein (DUF1330 family)